MTSVPTIRREIIPRWQRFVEEIIAIGLAGSIFALSIATIIAALTVAERMFGNILTW